jgi:hypothetical protein
MLRDGAVRSAMSGGVKIPIKTMAHISAAIKHERFMFVDYEL